MNQLRLMIEKITKNNQKLVTPPRLAVRRFFNYKLWVANLLICILKISRCSAPMWFLGCIILQRLRYTLAFLYHLKLLLMTFGNREHELQKSCL